MKNAPVLIIVFYLVLAGCLWPLFLAGSPVAAYVQGALAAHKLAAMPPLTVLIAAVQAIILIWAIAGAVLLYRKGLDGSAWLVVVLVLMPTLVTLAGKYA